MSKKFWSTLPLGTGVTLLTVDANGLAAFSKPAGVLSHPNRISEQPRALLTVPYVEEGEYYEWSEPEKSPSAVGLDLGRAERTPHAEQPPSGPSKLRPYNDERRGDKSAPDAKKQSAAIRRLWLLNRLDSATSGVILAASTQALADEIRAMFQRRHVRKIYNALVFGKPSEARQIWKDRLAVQKRGAQIRTAAHSGIPSESHMRVLGQKRGDVPLALIQLEPKTGRSHQLRVQCTQRHLPIVGDATYGDFKANREFARTTGEKRLFLHSLETSFAYTFGGKEFQFSAQAPLPPEFNRV
jgi:tRNA pseudouridine65 synthase